MLEQLVNYGSNLVPRALASCPATDKHILICGTLLKQVVMMLDAAHVLISRCCCDAAFVPLRAAFEASLYLEWMIADTTDEIASAYQVAQWREQRIWAERVIPSTEEAQEYRRAFASWVDEGPVVTDAQLEQQASEAIAMLDQHLASEKYAPINIKFQQAKDKRGVETDWFKVAGAPSIAAIAKRINKREKYSFFYGKASKLVHARDMSTAVIVEATRVRLTPIRNIKSFNELFIYFTSVAFDSYFAILKEYRSGEIAAFRKQYTTDWRPAMLSIPSINFSFRDPG